MATPSPLEYTRPRAFSALGSPSFAASWNISAAFEKFCSIGEIPYLNMG